MTKGKLLALGLRAALLAILGAAAPVFAAVTCTPDGDNHPSVAFIFGQQSDPGTCHAEVIAGCAAVLISPTVALTTGSCAVVWSDPAPFNVTATWLTFSSESILDCGEAVRIASIHPHPAFDINNEQSPYNIGVIVLAEPSSATPATLPVAGEVDGYSRGNILDVVSPASPDGAFVNSKRHVGTATFFKLTDAFFTLRKSRNGCVPGIEGGGAFLPSSQDLSGLIMSASWPGVQNTYLRLDIPEVRDFLDDFVALP